MSGDFYLELKRRKVKCSVPPHLQQLAPILNTLWKKEKMPQDDPAIPGQKHRSRGWMEDQVAAETAACVQLLAHYPSQSVALGMNWMNALTSLRWVPDWKRVWLKIYDNPTSSGLPNSDPFLFSCFYGVRRLASYNLFSDMGLNDVPNLTGANAAVPDSKDVEGAFSCGYVMNFTQTPECSYTSCFAAALYSGWTDILMLMLKYRHGADNSVCDSETATFYLKKVLEWKVSDNILPVVRAIITRFGTQVYDPAKHPLVLRNTSGAGQFESVKYLLEVGAKDYIGASSMSMSSTAIVAAAGAGCVEAMELLIKHGANQLHDTDWGEFFYHASDKTIARIVPKLRAAGVEPDLDVYSRGGNTPLLLVIDRHNPSETGMAAGIQTRLELGADINKPHRDDSDKTPMGFVLRKNACRSIQVLLSWRVEGKCPLKCNMKELQEKLRAHKKLLERHSAWYDEPVECHCLSFVPLEERAVELIGDESTASGCADDGRQTGPQKRNRSNE